MKIDLKELIQKSGKKTTVVYDKKDKRRSFDEQYAKDKMNVIKNFIGVKSIEVSKKLAER